MHKIGQLPGAGTSGSYLEEHQQGLDSEQFDMSAQSEGILDQHRVAIEHINEHGFYIWPDAFDKAFCDEILDEIVRLERDRVPRSLDNDFHGHKTVRYYDVLNQGEVWQHVATHPNLLPVARGVLGNDCLLNTFGTSIINPGETAQPIHVDDGPFISARNSALRHRPRLGDGERRESIVLNTMIALCDFTEEIGATRFVPDSPKLPYPRPEDSDKWFGLSRPAEMPKGGVLFFEGQCFHAGGANRTRDQRRPAVTVDFCAGYLRTQENFLLSIPAERVETFSDDLRELVGLRLSGGGGLGHVYNHKPDGLMRHVAMPATAID